MKGWTGMTEVELEARMPLLFLKSIWRNCALLLIVVLVCLQDIGISQSTPSNKYTLSDQTWLVIHNVNLRRDPSVEQPPIVMLSEGDSLVSLGTCRQGFC